MSVRRAAGRRRGRCLLPCLLQFHGTGVVVSNMLLLHVSAHRSGSSAGMCARRVTPLGRGRGRELSTAPAVSVSPFVPVLPLSTFWFFGWC
jgi:hypothetical protein